MARIAAVSYTHLDVYKRQAGMIGSNMAQTAMMMKLTPNICLYDPFAPALEGVAEELYHCGFEGVNLTYTCLLYTSRCV